MHTVSVAEAAASLDALLDVAEAEDVTLMQDGQPAGVLMSAGRYESLLERLEDLGDALAVVEFRAQPEPTVEAGEFFKSTRENQLPDS